jgi:hypothetical protein
MKRRLFASTALVSVVTACATPPATANAQSVFAQIQYILPLVKVLVTGIAIAVPASAGVVTTVMPYLVQAGTAFQALSATMTQTAAQPIVQQVEGYLTSAVDVVAAVVNGAAPGTKLAEFAPEVAEAQAVLALIVAFANGVQTAPTTTAAIKIGSLPLLHR